MKTYGWFVVAQTSTWKHGPTGHVLAPSSTSHAKTMGTALTACGILCTSWPKLWEMRYVPGRKGQSCPQCDAVLRTKLSSRTSAD